MNLPTPSKKMTAWAGAIAAIMTLANVDAERLSLPAMICIAVITAAYTVYQAIIDREKIKHGIEVKKPE